MWLKKANRIDPECVERLFAVLASVDGFRFRLKTWHKRADDS